MSVRALHAIIFDFDGVIANSEQLHLKAFQATLDPRGVTLSHDDYYAHYLGFDDVGVFRQVMTDRGLPVPTGTEMAALIDEKGAIYDRLAAAGDMLYPGAAEFLRAAAQAVPVAIASGAHTSEIDEVLTRAGLRSLVPVVVGADQTSRSKPDPEPYRTALQRLADHCGRRLEPWRTVAIEDSHWGLASAKGADLRLVAVSTTYPAHELRPHAELVTTALSALTIDMLDELVGD
ncbi:MAG: HAD family phosphatase [Acidobacteria bacterium]|nr:HAD family phosphatase [Acidobacteriota bacterium]